MVRTANISISGESQASSNVKWQVLLHGSTKQFTVSSNVIVTLYHLKSVIPKHSINYVSNVDNKLSIFDRIYEKEAQT